MPSDTALPHELISRILGCVHSDCTLKDKQNLVSCSLVSYAWHELTLPFLFREVSFQYDAVRASSLQSTATPGSAETQVQDGVYDEGGIRNRAVTPAKTRRLDGFVAFLHSRPDVARAIHELSLGADRSPQKGEVTDHRVFVRILQCLPSLRILHLKDVVLGGPEDAISQAREEAGYQPITLDELHWTDLMGTRPFLDFDEPWIVRNTHVLWLLRLFRRIQEFHVHQSGVLAAGGPVPTAGDTPEIVRFFLHGWGPYKRCHILHGIRLAIIQFMDLGRIHDGDLDTIGDLLAGATDLQHFRCGIEFIATRHGLLCFDMFASHNIRTLTFYSIELVQRCLEILFDILCSVSRVLEAASPSHPRQDFAILRLAFVSNPRAELNDVFEGVSAVPEELRKNLNDVLLRLTNPPRDVTPVRLWLTHDTMEGEQWEALARSMLPDLHKMETARD